MRELHVSSSVSLLAAATVFSLIVIAVLTAINRRETAAIEPSLYAAHSDSEQDHPGKKGQSMSQKVIKSDEEWQRQLSPDEYNVTRRKGTERAFSGAYWNLHEKGTFTCVCCGNELFSSETKFDSGTGWPSFWGPIGKENVSTKTDTSHGMRRTEVLCSRCDAHLGHVFEDGPPPTHLRYCINSVSLKFVKQQ
jgi:peptide-methionine (R)-S-oxide reductase